MKAWTAIDKLSVIWKSDLTDKMKRSFFQAAVLLILLYRWTTWTLTKRLEKLDGNYTRMLLAILNKSWRQHPTKHQLYSHLPPIRKTKLDERGTQDTAGGAGTSSYVGDHRSTSHMDEQKQDDQQERTYSRYVKIWDIAEKTCQRRWTIGKSGERGSGISMLAARHDDDTVSNNKFQYIFPPVKWFLVFLIMAVICKQIWFQVTL